MLLLFSCAGMMVEKFLDQDYKAFTKGDKKICKESIKPINLFLAHSPSHLRDCDYIDSISTKDLSEDGKTEQEKKLCKFSKKHRNILVLMSPFIFFRKDRAKSFPPHEVYSCTDTEIKRLEKYIDPDIKKK